uniref:Cystatin domain-containing protein n=1 Tax=Chlamydomonas leiostraca TaxID=1034604 RepID=A0A7S0WJC3_9CHLO|mmetsp:Transcript_15684/g.39124  ORF Transcript_15684/g.39124 Transcript_15684/m.39124 type:complete len:130 (+) Transcript_15684:41-430(+)
MKSLFLVLLAASVLGLAMSKTAPIVGGVSEPQEVTDDVQKAADIAVNLLNKNSELRGSLGAAVEKVSLVRITSVRTQVVAGMNYHLTLTMKDQHGKQFDTEVVIWGRPWLESSNAEEAWQLTKVNRLDS